VYTIGDRIKQLRKLYNCTQKEFGEFIGVTDAHISKIESGKDLPSAALIKEIAITFNVREEWISTGEGEFAILEKSALGRNILTLLHKRNINLRDVAEATSVSHFDLFRMTNSSSIAQISIVSLISLSKFFNVSIDWLLTGQNYSIEYEQSNEESVLSSDEKDIVTAYRSVSEYKKYLISQIIETISRDEK
jgi:transcriptional regulator with XRE-family HTH domain